MLPIHILIWQQEQSDEAHPSKEALRFQSELQQHTTQQVEIRPSHLSNDQDAFLIIDSEFTELPRWMIEVPPDRRSTLLARTFLLHGPKSPNIFKTMEQHNLCGGVDALGNFMWNAHPEKARRQIVGLRAVAERLGGLAEPSLMTASEHYAMYKSPSATTLAHAVVEYFQMVTSMRAAGQLNA
jgi:hypothetical protein